MADDIRQWLEALELGKYGDVFVENEVNVRELPAITDDDLKELGLPLGPRRRILMATRTAQAATPEPAGRGQGEAAPASEAERRQLTVMFCDLVGSTALSQQLDPEDLRDIMRAYQDAVSGAIVRYGGHVAKHLGDGVLAYFGWPQAYEDQAERAVRSGLDAVAAVGELQLARGRVLQARVGIASGQVVVGDLVGETGADLAAVSGETPNLAARLQGVAEPGQIVVGSATRELIGTAFELEPLGRQDLKGFSEAVSAWRVLHESTTESRFEAAQTAALGRLVGREHELGLLKERWELAKGGEGQIVLLSGEAGFGKSRIVRAAQELIGQDRHYYLRYQCSPYHVNSAFHPLIRQLESTAGFAAGDSGEIKLDKLEALLASSFTDLAAAAPLFAALLSLPGEDRYGPLDLTPAQRRDRIFAALAGHVLGLSRQRPVFLVIEDVQWLDPTTQDFVGEVITQAAESAAFVLITHRPDYAAPWKGHRHLTSLALNRLSREQAGKIVEAVGEGRLSGPVVDKIVARADGVPLFVEELTKSVLEAGEISGGPIAVDAVPATLQASLTARLDRLGEAKQIAQIGAVIGREFSHDLVAAVSGDPEVKLNSGLDRLIDAELVFRAGNPRSAVYTFKHALIQEVAYAGMLKDRRSRLHEKIADVLERKFPTIVETEPEVLARHYSMAGMTGPAIAHWRRAGELSAEASANIEAVSHFETALEMLDALPENEERDGLELELRIALGGPLLMIRGHGAPEVGRTYSRARELCQKIGDAPQIVPALFGMWRFYIGRGDCTITRDLGRQLLDIGKSGDDASTVVLGHYGLGFALFCYGDLQGAREQLEDGDKLYDTSMRDNLSFRLGQDPGVACLSYCALALWVLGYPDQARRANLEAIELADRLSHPFSQVYALSLACQVLQHRGEVDEVLKMSETAIGIAQEQGFAVWIASPSIFKGWAKARQGSAREGAHEVNAAMEAIVKAGMEMRRPYYLALAAECLTSADQFTEAGSVLDEALAIVAATDEHWSEAELLRLRGEIESRDDVAAAEASFQAALELARRQEAKSWELRAAISLARLWHRQGRHDEARDILRPVHDWFTEGFDTPDLIEAGALLGEWEADR